MLEEGTRFLQLFSIGVEEMERFGALSGDLNPLHVDDHYARTKGFEGRVVYGALLVARVSRLIGMELPANNLIWNSVDMKFRSPLYMDRPARLEAEISHVAESIGAAELKLTITMEGKKIATGKAMVTLL